MLNKAVWQLTPEDIDFLKERGMLAGTDGPKAPSLDALAALETELDEKYGL